MTPTSSPSLRRQSSGVSSGALGRSVYFQPGASPASPYRGCLQMKLQLNLGDLACFCISMLSKDSPYSHFRELNCRSHEDGTGKPAGNVAATNVCPRSPTFSPTRTRRL
jgi:hypothetical protein